MSELKTQAADSAVQISPAASTAGESVTRLRDRALERLKGARKKATRVQVVVLTNSKKAARATDDFVHEHPWACIGIATGVGALVGLLINRD